MNFGSQSVANNEVARDGSPSDECIGLGATRISFK